MNRPNRPILVETIKRRPPELTVIAPEPAAIPQPLPSRPPKLGPFNAAWVGLGDRVREVGGIKYLDGAFCTVQGVIREYNRACQATGQDQVGPDHLRA